MGLLYAKNKIYNGYDGNTIGFQASSSISSSAFSTVMSGSFYISSPSSSLTIAGKVYRPFSGSFQELRFYKINLQENQFDDYVMDPYSIEGNELIGPQSALNSLIFRAPLGTVLDNGSNTTRTSIHPKISTIPAVQSFYLSGSSTYTLNGTYSFIPQNEIIYQNQFHAGVKNAVSEKIRIISSSLAPGNVLSQYVSIQQQTPLDETFAKDVNYIEVAFSPQDEINDDIISQLGSFNIGNYIGDPRQVSSSLTYYPDFNVLRNSYFSKYTENYNLWDYIRLIKFYDNSLFKMIQDFTPARAGLATGIIIKQTLLERNKYPLPQATTNSEIAFVGSPTTKTINIAY
jgi:hypothetical protein